MITTTERRDALLKIAYVGPKVNFMQDELVPGFGKLIDKGDPCVFMGKKYPTPAAADAAMLRLKRMGAIAKKVNSATWRSFATKAKNAKGLAGAAIATSIPLVLNSISKDKK